ncbi:hypothetical protein [Dysgonomonas sp. 520]|uniref:hypothetical protein n=1 Tax=Dysgonomonas sp. 520 TaxID=2302931 RepID=UPI0013D1A8F7|nr:hypothetical protein [Dysgonomonas sp. 520]NDW11257.1 hypothetical protein [Dysgonomonas sp. 520]
MNLKTQRILVIAIAIIFILLIIAIIAPKSTPTDQESQVTENIEKYINGLEPADVYLNMEQQGFETQYLPNEFGSLWISSKKVQGIDFRVEIYSSNRKNLESVRATAMIDITQKDIQSTQQFLLYVASIPYDSSNYEAVAKWLKDNFNNDKASIVVSGVRFTISAPTKMVRILNIEKEINPEQ